MRGPYGNDRELDVDALKGECAKHEFGSYRRNELELVLLLVRAGGKRARVVNGWISTFRADGGAVT